MCKEKGTISLFTSYHSERSLVPIIRQEEQNLRFTSNYGEVFFKITSKKVKVTLFMSDETQSSETCRNVYDMYLSHGRIKDGFMPDNANTAYKIKKRLSELFYIHV
jgi:hypothetical protein